MLFHILEDKHVILRSKGIFKQAKVFERNGELFANWGSGFIRLYKDGTSLPHVSIVEHNIDCSYVGQHRGLYLATKEQLPPKALVWAK